MNNFSPTKTATIANKEKFFTDFKKFMKSEFSRKYFTKAFYNRLSMMFGFIRHYDQYGFWDFYFNNGYPYAFIADILQYPCWGDPQHTFSDVEKAIQQWINSGCP